MAKCPLLNESIFKLLSLQLLAVAWKQETLPTYMLPDCSPHVSLLTVQRMYLAMLLDTVYLKGEVALIQSKGINSAI